MEPVKQVRYDVYTPNLKSPEPNFYAWTLAASKVLPLREDVGEGKFKHLFHIAGTNDVLALFKLDSFTPEKTEEIVRDSIREMMSLCSKLTERQIAFLLAHACYPKAVYCTPKGRCGFIMPQIPRNFRRDATFACSHPRLVQAQAGAPFKNYLHMAMQAALFFDLYHRHGFVYGDISYNNICVDPASGGIYVIDVDGVCDYSAGKTTSAKTVHSHGFAAPETLLKGAMSVNAESFTLAIFLYGLLLHRHPLLFGRPMPDGIIAEETEKYFLGTNPIYVDDPSCDENRQVPFLHAAYGIEGDGRAYPWANPNVTPARMILGESLAQLFERTFVDCVSSGQRSSAGEFVTGCIKTLNQIVPCTNVLCGHGWAMPSHSASDSCPVCGRSLVPHVSLCVYRRSDQNGRYVLAPDDRLSVYDFRALYEINFKCWSEILESGCETGTLLGSFQEDINDPGRFFFVSKSSKVVVLSRLNDKGVVSPSCIACGEGGRTDLLEGGTILFQPDNPNVLLFFPTGGALPLDEIFLSPVTLNAKCESKCRENWCRTPVSQRWEDWLDVWKCQEESWLHRGGVPLGKCLDEVKVVLSELKSESKRQLDRDEICDCARVDALSSKLDVLKPLAQHAAEDLVDTLLRGLDGSFQQVVKDSERARELITRAIEGLKRKRCD